MNAPEILKQLRVTGSTNAKLKILQENANNLDLQKSFRFAYDNRISFFIGEKALPVLPSKHGISTDMDPVFNVFDRLAAREVTGHAGALELTDVIVELDEDHRELALDILKRDLRCGVAASQVNKVWKGACEDYPCMLAMKDDPKNRARFKEPFIAQIKSDGARINLCVDLATLEVTAFTRNGKPVDCVSTKIRDQALAGISTIAYAPWNVGTSANQSVWYLDGELLVADTKGSIVDRKTGNGIVNKAVKGTISEKERESFVMSVWDVFPSIAFVQEKWDVPYVTRWNMVLSSFREMSMIRPIETRRCDSWVDVQKFYAEVVEMGQEGLIIKSLDGIWENKRSKGQMKMKEYHEMDLQITGIVEGVGKFSGMLGAFIMADASGTLETNVGIGKEGTLTDDVRKHLWNIRETLIGKIAAVGYNEIINDKRNTDKKSLFLPRFVELREDKYVADSIA